MTAGTGTNDMRVIDCTVGHWCPGYWTGLVTGFTGVGGINMTGGFARCQGTVVTAGTDTQYLRVIDRVTGNRCPRLWWYTMAGIAQVTAADMVGRFS